MEDILRPLGIVGVVFGFLLVALGIAQSFHAIPPTQFSDTSLESLGGIILFIGFALTAIARLFGEPASISATPRPPVTAASNEVSFKITKTTRTSGVDPAGMIPTALSHLVDASSKGFLAGMLADLEDPSKPSTIQIEGGYTAQIKDELRKLLALAVAAETPDATGPDPAEPAPSAPEDVAANRLRELDDLHTAGVLSDQLYQAARAKLLG